ncbi:TolC family protein [Puia sp.]|jgi:outer membrane protein TolC|uniref:TolC family protein n=1 Tax=Puia sp. TaxID=2045100 RepID=UPI002F3FDD5E
MKRILISSGFSFLVLFANAQTGVKRAPDTLSDATLQACVQFALKHYPLVQQALLDEQITDRQIKSKLADWYPQVDLNANYQNNFQLPAVAFAGQTVRSGTYNTSTVGFALTQNLFTRDVLLAARTKGDVMNSVRQTTVSDKIDVTVNVSKAFYDVLLTEKQIDVLADDIVRLERNYKDAYNQYRGGLVDKTDYKRATISLNNSMAEKKTDEEALKAKYAALKQLMGYTAPDSLHLVYDSAQMESEVYIDTLTPMDYSKRIEYQQLMTQKRLQQADVKYQKWAYFPTVTAGAGYNLNYLNSRFGPLYKDNFPNSYAGLQVAFPIFQGTKRQQNIRIAELQLTRIDWDMINLQTAISTQYTEAMAIYKSNLNNYHVLRENLDLARDVFNTIELQYRSGVKAYLELITAETDLRTAQVNYSNALYLVLSSKLDVQKALGIITY